MTWAVHLSVQDVGANNASTPSLLRVTIRQSKTDPFWKGVDLYFGKTSSSICPVAAVLSYLMVREAAPGCLFIRTGRSSHVGGSPKHAARGTLASEGIDHTKYCIHNFHIRVTTTAAAKGIGDAAIKVVEPCSMCTFPENSWVLLSSDRIALDFINDNCCKLGLAEEAGPLLGLDGGYTLLILPLCLIHDTG